MLFQNRSADMTLGEDSRVASPEIVLMSSSDMKALGLKAGSMVTVDTEEEDFGAALGPLLN